MKPQAQRKRGSPPEQSAVADYISTAGALDLVKGMTGMDITLPTLINWLKKKGFGRKVGGRWQVDKKALVKFITNNNK